MSQSTTKTTSEGNEQLDAAAAEPTLDEFLRRRPDDLTDADLRRMVEIERGNRARFIAAQAARKAKKAGVEEPAPAPTETEEDSDAS
jgi:hypothetical protein